MHDKLLLYDWQTYNNIVAKNIAYVYTSKILISKCKRPVTFEALFARMFVQTACA